MGHTVLLCKAGTVATVQLRLSKPSCRRTALCAAWFKATVALHRTASCCWRICTVVRLYVCRYVVRGTGDLGGRRTLFVGCKHDLSTTVPGLYLVDRAKGAEPQTIWDNSSPPRLGKVEPRWALDTCALLRFLDS